MDTATNNEVIEFNVITGATGGLGKEFAKQLLDKGEPIFITARSEEKLFLLKRELTAKYKNAVIEYKKCDLVNEEDRKAFFDNFTNFGYKVKGLYYVAGADIRKPFTKYTQRTVVFQARVNYEACIDFTNFTLSNRAENLKILVVSSLTGITPMPYFAEYSSLKGALISFFTALRYELKNSNVKITVLTPGSIPTRSDIKQDIEKQGLQGKLSKKSPEYVVKKGLSALEKNKLTCTPGFYNKVVKFVTKITPLSLKLKIVAKKLKNLEKDAFTND